MSLKETEQRIVKDAKAEFDYVTKPENCGVVVRNNFDGIVFSIYGFIFLFLLVCIGGFYLYTRQQHTHAHPVVYHQPGPGTQPQ